VSLSPEQIKEAALDEFATASISEKSTNQYEIAYDGTKSKIEIGDSAKSANFKPDLTISHWNGEVSFKLIAPVGVEAKEQLSTSFDLAKSSVTASSRQWSFEYKVTEPKEGFNEFGGMDMIITAKEKPSSNKIYFTYDSSTATPYYQPPLADEYKDGWSDEFGYEIKVSETQVLAVADAKGNELKEPLVLVERPDYVVGSIALYADGKANYSVGGVNYATGKIGHLYAMQCNGEWCRWSIEHEFLVLTIPDDVFNGKYPVVIAPVGDTFGYTGTGNSSIDPAPNSFRGVVFAAPADGSATSLSIYCHNISDNTSAPKAVLVLASNLNIITNGVGNVADPGIPPSSAGWGVSSFDTSPAITNGVDYVLGFVWNTCSWMHYDSGEPLTAYYDTSNSYTTPTNPTDASAGTQKFSIYCTYTPGGGNTAPTVTSQAASSVEETTATLNGNITATGGVNPTDRGFQYDTDTGAPYASDTHTTGDYGTGAYTADLTSLTKGEEYFARAYATNTEGTGYGSEVTFLTKPDEPTALGDTTRSGTSITMGWTGSTGADKYMLRYRTDAYPTDPANGTQAYFDTGTSYETTGLSSGQIYYFRVWAWCTEGGLTQYSDSYSSDTDYTLPDTVSSFTVTGTTTDAISLGWTKGTGGDKTYIRGKKGSYPTDRTDGYEVYFDTGTSVTDSSLDTDSDYYYRAWSYDTDSGYYDSYAQVTGHTGATAPTVTNSTGESNVADTVAVLNGNLTDDGNISTTVHVYWGDNDGGTTAGSWDNDVNIGATAEGAFMVAITELTAETDYYYRCYAVNSVGSDWADATETLTTEASGGGGEPPEWEIPPGYAFTVDPNGGSDYTSISAWQAAKKSAYSSGDVVIAYCKRTGATKDTTTVNITGWTAGVIPKIIVDPDYRSDGGFQDQNSLGNYVYTLRSTTDWATGLACATVNTYVEGMQVEMTAANASAYSCVSTVTFVDCIAKAGSAGFTMGTYGQGSNQFRNCFAYDCKNGFIDGRGDNNSGRYCRIENCVSYSASVTGINAGYGSIVNNCVSVASTTTDFASSNSFAPGANNNVSSDGTAPGATKAINKTDYASYFVDITTGNPHLLDEDSELWGINGADLSSRFDTDIDRQIRVTWDIGCDEYLVGGAGYDYDIANDPTTKAFGVVAPSSTYYAKGSAPSNPVQNGECTYTLTNSGDTVKILVKVSNGTGGVGWTAVTGSPSENCFRITAYQTGTNPASGIVLKLSDQQFIASLAAGTTYWDFKFETGSSFTDGVQKTITITFTAVAED
jgi:hypothetical protein